MASRSLLLSPPRALSCMWRDEIGMTWFIYPFCILPVPPHPEVPLRLDSNQYFCLPRWPIHLFHTDLGQGIGRILKFSPFGTSRGLILPSAVPLLTFESSSSGLCDTNFPERSNSEVASSWIMEKKNQKTNKQTRISVATHFHFLKSS